MTPTPRAPRRFSALRGLSLLFALFALSAGATLAAPASAADEAAPADATPPPVEAKPDYTKPLGPSDPHNRGTPAGSMHGFIEATRGGDFDRAAEHLDLRRLPKHRQDDGPLLSRQLKTVLDRTLFIDLDTLSATNDGRSDDGLPAWQDELGRIKTADGTFQVLLQRVPREGDGVRIWKLSASTVAGVPDLYQEFGYGLLEKWLPSVFFETSLLDVELWQWTAVLGVVFIAWLASWIFATVLIRAVRPLVRRTASKLDDRIIHLIRNPARLVLAVVLFHAGTTPLGLPVRARATLGGFEKALLVVAIAWILMQLVDLASLSMRERLTRRGQGDAIQLISPGRKTVKLLITLLAGLFVLDNMGFNVTALIAGLGVGGIAFALASQKTIENLFGGVVLFTDRPVRVGDFCRFGDKVGTVEEIGMRSTRIRTLDRTIVTVPNAEFSALQLENFASRDQIRLHTILGVRYETTPEQMRYVLARLREMLLAHPKISPDPARVRFVAFGAYSLDLEVFAYARTADWNEFLQIREDVFLRTMDIIEETGTGFAFPSTTTYVGRDDGLDEKRGAAAEDAVAKWRDEGVLPFPEFAEARRTELGDTLDWPPEGSPGRPRRRDGAPSMGADE